jgi:hypothetical protein
MSKESLIKKAYELQEQRRQLRQKERNLSERSKFLRNQPLVADSRDLRANIDKIIPKHLSPKNIGNYHEVMWPFWYNFEFDFGIDPTYTSLTRQVQSIQISQESAFLLTTISRAHEDRSSAGQNAPLQMTLRDNQSSRQFNDKPIPLQMIGTTGDLTHIETPLFIRPNASLSIEMTSWLPGDFATTGVGKHEIMIHGFRIRSEDASKVLASIFV